MDQQPALGQGLSEVAIVWAMLAFYGLAVFVTYSRIDPAELYHVSGDGLPGGFSRLVVWLSFPAALMVIPLTLVSISVLLQTTLSARQRGGLIALAAMSLFLTLIAPFTADEADLDARLINIPGVIGVLLSLALAIIAVRRAGASFVQISPLQQRVSWVVAGVLAVLGLSWIFVENGVYTEEIPLLGWIYASIEVSDDGAERILVHLGDHHGFAGFMLAITALILARLVGTLQPRWLDRIFTWYISLMFVYGVANAAQDFSLEQIVKRGWAENELPPVLSPEPNVAWLLILLLTFLVHHVLVVGSRR